MLTRATHGCGLFQRRVHAAQQGNEHQKCGGHRAQALDEDHSGERVDIEWCGLQVQRSHEALVEEAHAGAREQRPSHGLQHARHGEGHRQARVNPDLPGHVGALGEPGQTGGKDETKKRAATRKQQRVPQNLVGGRIAPDLDVVRQGQRRQREFRGQAGRTEAAQHKKQDGRRDCEEDDQEDRSLPEGRGMPERPRMGGRRAVNGDADHLTSFRLCRRLFASGAPAPAVPSCKVTALRTRCRVPSKSAAMAAIARYRMQKGPSARQF